jgi:serine protease Do
MTDEKNITPQPSGDGREVISWYVPPERGNEVVRCYVQPQPLPQGVRPQPPHAAAPKQKKKRGWVIFVILAAVLAVIVGVTALVVSLTGDEDPSTPDDGNAGSIVDISGNEECYIPKAPAADGLQMELLAPGEMELTPTEVYQKMSASTVTVLATDDRGNTSMGTGVLLTADGYIVTNAHVVSGASSGVVALDTGRTYEAELVGYAPGRDIAVLKAVDAQGLTPAEFCDSDYCTVGETVYVIGNPLNLNLRGTFTNGILSGLEREMELDGKTLTMLQTNAAVNNGNSGGPLINAHGQVIGIVTMKMSQNESRAEATVEGLGFALPTSQVAYVVNDILAHGEFHGIPTFGFTIETAYGEDGSSQLTVRSVEEDLGAAAAGVEPGDVILAADGQPIRDNWDLLDYRRTVHVGDTVDLTILRDGQEIHCYVTLTATM